MSKSKESAVQTLEDQLRRLQEIASLLDAGDLPLEEQLRLYEEGITLANTCRDYLTSAELRIQNLAGGNVSSAT
ncbi:MAG: exodeoxyribonuclease VII small subunit [bacterium]|nr:exodeoxyribonuclease VII small subunit [bacterium]